jgi:hypothetical protein
MIENFAQGIEQFMPEVVKKKLSKRVPHEM